IHAASILPGCRGCRQRSPARVRRHVWRFGQSHTAQIAERILLEALTAVNWNALVATHSWEFYDTTLHDANLDRRRLERVRLAALPCIMAPRPVAQICNLLYRRVALGRTWNCLCAQQHAGARRSALRRLQICDTAECNSALRAWTWPSRRGWAPRQVPAARIISSGKPKRGRRFALPPHSIVRLFNMECGAGWRRMARLR